MFSKDLFKDIMSEAVSLVYITTTNGEAGKFGLTMTALTTVTIEPPTILISVNRNSSLYIPLNKHKKLCVNLLCAEQEDIAKIFSGQAQVPYEERFNNIEYKLTKNNQIFFPNSIAYIEGNISKEIIESTHAIFIITITDGSILEHKEHTLLYSNRIFKTMKRK